MEQAPLRIGIVGLGTVGASVVNLLHNEAGALAQRSPRPLQVVAVSARDAGRSRGLDLTNIQWMDDPVALAVHPDVDVVVELIGGSEGTARAVVEAALVVALTQVKTVVLVAAVLGMPQVVLEYLDKALQAE
jgi:homoserine dehydrogenase